MWPRTDEKQMVRYLCGQLSEEQMGQIEDRMLADDYYFGRLSAVEHELVDGFVRGDLSRSDRERFERSYLTSPTRCERLEFAKALLGSASMLRAPDAAGSESIPLWHPLSRFVRGPRTAYGFALAVTLLLVVAGGSWLVVETARLRTQIAALQARRAQWQVAEMELKRRAALQGTAIAQLTEQLRQERGLRAELERNSASLSSEIVMSFVLVPGLVRDVESAKRLVIPSNASRLRIQLDVSGQTEHEGYRATVRTATGDEIWSQDSLRCRSTGSTKAVVLTLPAHLFDRGDYVVMLRGVRPGGGWEDLEYYQFSVQKP